ncbi:MAG: hypothetical protein OXS28_05200 [Gammaproteobacteria bacterium]|nr:hypothetical protein [Gammaproteobacteria bacterium]
MANNSLMRQQKLLFKKPRSWIYYLFSILAWIAALCVIAIVVFMLLSA